MVSYLSGDPRVPLSVAIFGPPGSGKSTVASELAAQAASALQAEDVKLTTLNLTQLSSVEALGAELARIKECAGPTGVPVVLFDEFDTRLNGVRWGWLPSFLAPMNDGYFVHQGVGPMRLERAIYLFAGGTAETLSEFSSPQDRDAFGAAKGPDFVSRLRGFLDIEGPNAEPWRAQRRAVLVRRALERRGLASGHVPAALGDELRRSLLLVGRYRHGARSVGAVVEGIATPTRKPADFAHLPSDAVLAIHVDRGPLDRRGLGGCVAMSAGTIDAYHPPTDDPEERAPFEHVWRAVSRELWKLGATLAYGGHWREYGLTSVLRTEARELPRSLNRGGEVEVRLKCFPPLDTPGAEAPPDGVELLERHLVENDREAALRTIGNGWLVEVLRKFRQRLQVTELSAARFVVGGTSHSVPTHRFPGVIEETMLSLAYGHPVYIAGAFGGGAAVVGELLGLARPWRGVKISPNSSEKELETIGDLLQPPPLQLPLVTAKDLEGFLRGRALGSHAWPENGLTVDENRSLFVSRDPEEIASLVTKGLCAVVRQ